MWPRSHMDFAALGLQSPWPLLSGPGGPHWVVPPSPSLPTAAGSPGLQGVGRPSPPPPPHAASFSSQRTSPLCPQVRPQRLCERPPSRPPPPGTLALGVPLNCCPDPRSELCCQLSAPGSCPACAVRPWSGLCHALPLLSLFLASVSPPIRWGDTTYLSTSQTQEV